MIGLAESSSILVEVLIAHGPSGKDIHPYHLNHLGNNMMATDVQMQIKLVNSLLPKMGDSAMV